MRRAGVFLALALVLSPGTSQALGLSVEVWTDRGNEAVYQPGDRMQVKVRSSSDAHVLVYEIDTEGFVRLLFPELGGSGFLAGRETHQLPREDSNVELVVQQVVGQSYIVAIASAAPFDTLPWYLRPYNAQAEAVGYVGLPPEEQGVTAEGKIVGDPFVAMERIRRRVIEDHTDGEAFATAYTTYYVHQAVRYPRYICSDCHRPGQWAWWDGFDPYYASCSVFDMRVNWSWYWGPTYWYGYVPYFVYAYRPNCPPRYHHHGGSGWLSSWDGWSTWCDLWGQGSLRRYKSAPPPGYQPPPKYRTGEKWRPGSTPPGFLAGNVRSGRSISPLIPVGRGSQVRGEGGGGSREERPAPEVRLPRGSGGRWSASGRNERPSPVMRPREESQGPPIPRIEEPAPAARPPRQERSAPPPKSPPPVERRGGGVGQSERPRDAGQAERPKDSGRSQGSRDTGAGRSARGGR